MNNTAVFITILLGVATTLVCYLDSLIEKRPKKRSDYIKAFLTGSIISMLTFFLQGFLALPGSREMASAQTGGGFSSIKPTSGGIYTAPPPTILTGNPNF